MIKPNQFVFQRITSSHSGLPAIIAASIGDSTPEKVQVVLGSYNVRGHYLIGCFDDSKLIGMVGFEVHNTKGIVRHIGVLPEHRLQGVGKALISWVVGNFHLQSITAETDNDAVNFYRKLGFTCQPFKGPYGKRYKCEHKPMAI